jgi:hypothetical protein
MEALIMRATPQANIIDRSGTTIPAKTAAEARKVLIQTARLQGGSVTVQQQGYDPSRPAEGNTLTIYSDGRIREHAETGPTPGWRVDYHSWAVDVEGTYIVPGVQTALSDARMLATKLDRPISVRVADIKPDERRDSRTSNRKDNARTCTNSGSLRCSPSTPKFGSVELRTPTDRPTEGKSENPVQDFPASIATKDRHLSGPRREHRLGRRTLLASLAAAVFARRWSGNYDRS